MAVTQIDLNQTATVVTVAADGFVRQFPAMTFCGLDVERFLQDVEEAQERVRQCRAVYMAGGNVIPFPGGSGDEKKPH